MWAHPLFIAKCARERFFENFDVFKLKRGCVTLRRNIPSVLSDFFQNRRFLTFIVICSIFFLFFEWEKFFLLWVTFFPSQGSKQLAREANFVMSSRRRDITKASRANCLLPSEGKKVTNSKKNFEHSKKREKKMNRLLF